jgi:hypothetical protein
MPTRIPEKHDHVARLNVNGTEKEWLWLYLCEQ